MDEWEHTKIGKELANEREEGGKAVAREMSTTLSISKSPRPAEKTLHTAREMEETRDFHGTSMDAERLPQRYVTIGRFPPRTSSLKPPPHQQLRPQTLCEEMGIEAMTWERQTINTKRHAETIQYTQGTVGWEVARKKRLESVQFLVHPAMGSSAIIMNDIPKETTKQVSTRRNLDGPPISSDLMINRPRPRYIVTSQRPPAVCSPPHIPEDGSRDLADHAMEKRVRDPGSRTSSVLSLHKPSSDISIQSSTTTASDETIEEKWCTFSHLAKSVKGKLATTKKAIVKESNATTAKSISSPVKVKKGQKQVIHELIEECKSHITETLKMTAERLRESAAQTKVVLDAVQRHKVQASEERMG
ncbi:hypothetical protein FKW77_007481 [Venturia effusa]|uniref:Uncharacterized protein n=1 Tax=Venturia effusa TaxID=50376 RepID=A0A517LB58_9PEZI|nr:hypothetical protein FKW77_007481 [Venturia effusa]